MAQKLRKTVLKKENKIQIAGCSELYMGIAFLPQRKAFFQTVSFHQFRIPNNTDNQLPDRKNYCTWTKLLYHKFLVNNC